ncbi:tol-pal system-associated acyl-CoA thioesterase [Celerinatantimonas sp. MCCC 1A17872]|uniref:tol-pal system-associated acyl-CoA thioesterase n=1 Tax=Celerinatantimonas sp. MCCC 1A17872 TaxID=3177514 RepID=UPI0038C046DB
MAQLTLRVYYEDTDAGGIVYHANHLKYMERGRTEMLREFGYEQDVLMAEGLSFVASEINIKYHHPARFNELLTVTTEIEKLRRVGILFHQAIHNQESVLIASADVMIASIDPNLMKPKAIPAKMKEVFQRAL